MFECGFVVQLGFLIIELIKFAAKSLVGYQNYLIQW